MSVSKDIETQIEQIIEKNNFKKAGINPEIIKNATEDVHISTKIIDKEGNSTNSHFKNKYGYWIFNRHTYIYVYFYVRNNGNERCWLKKKQVE